MKVWVYPVASAEEEGSFSITTQIYIYRYNVYHQKQTQLRCAASPNGEKAINKQLFRPGLAPRRPSFTIPMVLRFQTPLNNGTGGAPAYRAKTAAQGQGSNVPYGRDWLGRGSCRDYAFLSFEQSEALWRDRREGLMSSLLRL